MRRLVALRQRRALLATAAASAVALVAIGGLVQLALSGRMSLATAGAAALGVYLLSARLRGIFTGASSLYECGLFLADVTSFIDLQAAARTGQEPAVPPQPFSRLRMEGLWFTYPGTERSVLRDVDIEIGCGEVVALVGENGSGKTTLVKLLCGLYRPTAGRIVWGDVDLADLDPEAARRQVAVIFQDYLRYELSASANIGVGRHEHFADVERVRAAAGMAGAELFLAGLPSGYDTLLSRAFLGGSDLSVGQWQRVAVARALFRDAPLVILDEPTAALDAKAEHQLFERGRDLFADRAVLLISHRFSSVRWADRIYVLSEGAVVESGDHRSLMEAGGVYSELFELQAGAFRDREA
jgi:ATP-binding cassette, subfamily B, bacterial